nr:ATP synthase F0 subunit 8 [Anotylus sp. 'Oxytelopsis' 1 HFZ-2023b]
MPQMSPMNWLTLFFLFLIIFMIFNTLNYFSFTYSFKSTLMNKIKTPINWKW